MMISVVGLPSLILSFVTGSTAALTTTCKGSRLPEGRLHIAYATGRSLREGKVVEACCEHGVNVIVWAFAHLTADGVEPTFDVEEVVRTKALIADRGHDVVHLVSFGGWNGPHPSTRRSGKEWYDIWKKWNTGVFDGVDWDLEGHDDPTAETTTLTPALIALIVEFSALARSDGYVAGLAPPESYLDVGSSTFDLELNHQPRSPWDFSFPYAGRNAYAAILAEYQDFDFVSVQFYEGYSSACYALTRQGQNPADYLVDRARRFADGFDVEVDDGRSFRVKVPPERLVFGFANGWADGQKFVRFDPHDIAQAFHRLGHKRAPRGTMFWVLDEEGVDAPHHPVAMAPLRRSKLEDSPYFFARDLTDAFRKTEVAAKLATLADDW